MREQLEIEICTSCTLAVCDDQSDQCGVRQVLRAENSAACKDWYRRNREKVLAKKADWYQRIGRLTLDERRERNKEANRRYRQRKKLQTHQSRLTNDIL